MSLVEGYQLHNMAVDPNIKGTITLHLKNVTIEETLDAIQDTMATITVKRPTVMKFYRKNCKHRFFASIIWMYYEMDGHRLN